MDRDKPPFDPALKELAARDRRNLGPHPTPEQLAAYHARELPAEKVERIKDHLALCHECSALLLDLADFESPEPSPDAPALTDEDVDTAWQDLRARLAREGVPLEPPTAPVKPVPSLVAPVEAQFATPSPEVQTTAPEPSGTVVPLQRPELARRSPRLAYSLAAVFFLATVGLSIWNASLRRELGEPRVGVVVGPQHKDQGNRSGAMTTYPAQEPVMLSLPGTLPEAPQYTVEIQEVREGGTVVWTSEPIPAPSGRSRLLVQLPAGYLKPGDYLLRVRSVGGESDGEVEEFLIPITE